MPDYTLENVCSCMESNGTIFSYFTTPEATRFREISKEMKWVVENYPWRDSATRITGSIALWKACFPYARTANISRRNDLTGHDFCHFTEVQYLDMSGCYKMKLYPYAFSYLQGHIMSLNLSDCSQITDEYFPYIKGVRELILRNCYYARFTPEGIRQLGSILRIDVAGCSKEIRDAAYSVVLEQLTLM